MNRTTITLLSMFAIFVEFAPIATAADFVWTGKQDSNWHNKANWDSADQLPRANDAVIIADLKHGAELTLQRVTKIGSITFDPKALVPCSINQHSLVLGDGSRVQFLKLPGDVGMGKSAIQSIGSDLQLSGVVTFRNRNRWYLGGERLSVQGSISGAGQIVIGGEDSIGAIEFAADNSAYEGDIVIRTGSLVIRKASSLGSSDKPVRLEGGAFTIGRRIDTERGFHIAGDAAWDSHGPSGNHDGTVTVDRDVTWTIMNGGGNTMTLRGEIRGDGNVAITARGTTFRGEKSNTFGGRMSIGGARGSTILARDDGTTVIPGPLVMRDVGTLLWKSNEQIADSSSITFAGKLPTLALNGQVETVGTLDLQSDGQIDLGDSGGELLFSDSSNVDWSGDHVLLVVGDGGGNGVIRFGNTDNRLTDKQLNRIGFVNPTGLPPGTYSSKLTSEGRLVPTGMLVEPVDLPINLSSVARKNRDALYKVPGLEQLCGNETPLKKDMVISVFGDSITWGGGYLRKITRALASGEGTKDLTLKVINHGVNGGGVLSIRDGEDSQSHAGKTKPRPFLGTIQNDNADVAVIYIGVNDVWWRKTDPADFEKALADLVQEAHDNDTIPILATLAVMKEDVSNRNPKCDAFAQLTRKVATETDAILVDLRSAFWACMENESITIRPGGTWTSDSKLLTHDGVHMNDRGNEIVANLIAEGILEALAPTD